MGWIKERIDAEYRKHHKSLEWSLMAEKKIISQIKEEWRTKVQRMEIMSGEVAVFELEALINSHQEKCGDSHTHQHRSGTDPEEGNVSKKNERATDDVLQDEIERCQLCGSPDFMVIKESGRCDLCPLPGVDASQDESVSNKEGEMSQDRKDAWNKSTTDYENQDVSAPIQFIKNDMPSLMKIAKQIVKDESEGYCENCGARKEDHVNFGEEEKRLFCYKDKGIETEYSSPDLSETVEVGDNTPCPKCDNNLIWIYSGELEANLWKCEGCDREFNKDLIDLVDDCETCEGRGKIRNNTTTKEGKYKIGFEPCPDCKPDNHVSDHGQGEKATTRKGEKYDENHMSVPPETPLAINGSVTPDINPDFCEQKLERSKTGTIDKLESGKRITRVGQTTSKSNKGCGKYYCSSCGQQDLKSPLLEHDKYCILSISGIHQCGDEEGLCEECQDHLKSETKPKGI